MSSLLGIVLALFPRQRDTSFQIVLASAARTKRNIYILLPSCHEQQGWAMVNDLALSRDTSLNSSIIAMLLGAKTFVATYDLSLLLRFHLRIHNQRAKTGMYPLDFLKHLCAINLLCHSLSQPPLDCRGMLLVVPYVMTNQLKTRDRLGKKRRDLTGQSDS